MYIYYYNMCNMRRQVSITTRNITCINGAFGPILIVTRRPLEHSTITLEDIFLFSVSSAYVIPLPTPPSTQQTQSQTGGVAERERA